MKLFIRRKSIYYLIISLHALFLSLPVTHAGELVLCYKNAGQFGIAVTMPEGCSSCTQTGGDSAVQGPCFCVDIPLSKNAVVHSVLPHYGTSREKQQAPPLSFLSGGYDQLSPDKVQLLFPPPSFTDRIHESLHTTVLLI